MSCNRWMKNIVLNEIEKINERKANKLYKAIDSSDFYAGTAVKGGSTMNVTWRIKNEDLESLFINEASKQNLKTLKGHRSVEGRASIYNAFLNPVLIH